MSIPQEKLNRISTLPLADVEVILYTCIEVLGITDIKTTCEALGVQRSRIYQVMDENNTLHIGKHKFLMINKYIQKFNIY